MNDADASQDRSVYELQIEALEQRRQSIIDNPSSIQHRGKAERETEKGVPHNEVQKASFALMNRAHVVVAEIKELEMQLKLNAAGGVFFPPSFDPFLTEMERLLHDLSIETK